MENTKNKRVGIGQKPRGKQAQSVAEAPLVEKEVAVAAGQDQGVNGPVLEHADRVEGGGTRLDENEPKVAETEKTAEMPSVAVLESESEGENLADILAKSLRLTNEAIDPPFVAQSAHEDESGETVILADCDLPELLEKVDEGKLAFEIHPETGTLRITPISQLGGQPDGSFIVPLRLEEGYIEPVRQWAEAEGITVEEWVARQFSHYLETWGQPARSR